MKFKQAIIVISLISCMVGKTVSAQTPIPDTAADRANRVQILEQSLEVKANPTFQRELAMIYAVIAGLDNFKKKTVDKAENYLKSAVKTDPQDYELMATHGSVLAMKAAFEKSSMRQMMYVKKGTRKMDRAIKKDPDNIGARLQRGNNSLGLPVFLKRTHFAQKDFEHVLSLVGSKKGPEFEAMILFNLGQTHSLLKQHKIAGNYWNRSKALNTAYWSKKAAEKLN